MNGLQRLPANEETSILDLVRGNGLDTSKLLCEYSMQHDEGSYWSYTLDRRCNIVYDLMLCRFCGNFKGSKNNELYCPHKMNMLRAKLLSE